MIATLNLLLIVGVFVCSLLEALGKAPTGWIATMLLLILVVIAIIPK